MKKVFQNLKENTAKESVQEFKEKIKKAIRNTALLGSNALLIGSAALIISGCEGCEKKQNYQYVNELKKTLSQTQVKLSDKELLKCANLASMQKFTLSTNTMSEIILNINKSNSVSSSKPVLEFLYNISKRENLLTKTKSEVAEFFTKEIEFYKNNFLYKKANELTKELVDMEMFFSLSQNAKTEILEYLKSRN
jgi:hypothetical protein